MTATMESLPYDTAIAIGVDLGADALESLPYDTAIAAPDSEAAGARRVGDLPPMGNPEGCKPALSVQRRAG